MADEITKNKIAGIRKKMKAGIASSLEMAMVAQWELEHPKGRPRKSDNSNQNVENQINPESPGRGSGATPETGSPEIHNILPGGNLQGSNLPPIDIAQGPSMGGAGTNASGAAPNSSQSSQTNFASGATTNSNTPPNSTGPTMSSKEAEASASMLADAATKILGELNESNRKQGFPALGEQLIGLFHFSVKRMGIRYGAAIDEEAFDATAVIGLAGFVGYNSWKAHKKAQEESIFEKKNSPQSESSKPKEEVKANEQRNPAAPPNNGANGHVAPVGIIRSGRFIPAEKGGVF